VVLDKTGTITRGAPTLQAVHATGVLRDEELLSLAAAAERGSEHPLAEAIVRGAEDRGLLVGSSERFEALAGGGVRATVGGREVRIGSERFLADEGIGAEPLSQAAGEEAEQGRTPVLVAVDGTAAGVLALADPVKPESAEAVRRLHAAGVDVWMITGDRAAVARAIGSARTGSWPRCGRRRRRRA
jgi:Cu+-exporting ATPase